MAYPAAPRGQTRYALCELLYGLLCQATGTTPPWGMMTGVRPVRIIHDMRQRRPEEVRARFLDHFACTPENLRWPSALPTCKSRCWMLLTRWIAASTGIPFCRRGAAIAALCRARWGQGYPRPRAAYVDKLCEELTAIRETADRCGLHIRTFIGGGA